MVALKICNPTDAHRLFANVFEHFIMECDFNPNMILQIDCTLKKNDMYIQMSKMYWGYPANLSTCYIENIGYIIYIIWYQYGI